MPGTTTDTVPTMLTPGEFVIKRESAKMLGKPFLEKLNAVSDNSAHSNIDALISQAALAQMQPMMGGGVVNEYMGGGDVSNYMGGGDVMNYRYGGGVKKKKKMAGYQDGGQALSQAEIEALMPEQDMKASMIPMGLRDYNITRFLDPSSLSEMFSQYDSGMSPTQDDDGIEILAKMLLEDAKKKQYSELYNYQLPTMKATDSKRYNAIMELFGEMGHKGRVGDLLGMQDGGVVSDNTATSAMDALIAQSEIAQALKKKPQSQYSMVDADRVDAENQELIEMITSMAMPGAGVAGTAKKVTGKLPKLAKKFASMMPDRGKQAVLDKIASTMKVAPGRKIKQTPRDLYDWKGYEVLENTLNKPFDKMDLINPGYLQKFTNELVKVRNKPHLKQIGGKKRGVRIGDVVDAMYPRGFLNENELKRIGKIIPKEYREKELEKLLKSSRGKFGDYQDGGNVEKSPNPFMPFDQREPGSAASGYWGEFGAYDESLKHLMHLIELDSLLKSGEVESIERKPEFGNFLYNDFDEPKMSPADSSNVRNLIEYFNSQLMQGRDSSNIQKGIN